MLAIWLQRDLLFRLQYRTNLERDIVRLGRNQTSDTGAPVETSAALVLIQLN